jgi:hypothetical protein
LGSDDHEIRPQLVVTLRDEQPLMLRQEMAENRRCSIDAFFENAAIWPDRRDG